VSEKSMNRVLDYTGELKTTHHRPVIQPLIRIFIFCRLYQGESNSQLAQFWPAPAAHSLTHSCRMSYR
jgi:hypothetical protein